MRFSAEARDSYTILHLHGEFDTYYCPFFQKEIDDLVEAGSTHIVLNLRMVKFLNSTAMGAIIRAGSQLGKLNGKLAISRPSAFSREVLEKVGLERLVPIFDSDESAGEAVMARPKGDPLSDASIEDDESLVLFTLDDAERIEHFIPMEDRTKSITNPVHGHSFGGRWRGIGRMSGLDTDALRFTWGGGRTKLSPFEMSQMLAVGSDLRVKFRLPLLKPGHCEALVTVHEIEERADGVKVTASFGEIDDETRKAVQQYTEDMSFLKQELRKATESS
ncbi:MAG: anti-anti-sigma factor [Planctomycetota bacterium]|jgi:anti-anti-sigma factor